MILKADWGSVCCMLHCWGWLEGSDSVELIGILKVICLGCCLFSVVRASYVVTASLGTSNPRIPR